jgi:succinate-semialdehyde dehydrogenase/glutarate-semialdehyde dehydrogenase
MESVNPATGETLDHCEEDSAEEVKEALGRAADTFEEWRRRDFRERRRLVEAADLLRERIDEYAQLMSEEMGKPVAQARSEVEKCAWVCDYYAETAEEHLADEVLRGDASAKTLVSYEPLGPVLAVMPWNFPFWQVFRFAAPNLAAGNVGLLNHASNVPGCARAIESVFRDAGVPEEAVDDDSYSLIAEEFEEEVATTYGTDLTNPDFVALAESFGLTIHRPTTWDELDGALERAVGSDDLSLVAVPVAASEDAG